MNFKKKIIKFSIIQKFLAYVGYLYILFVGATSKIDIKNQDLSNKMWKEKKPFIPAFWHSQLMMIGYVWKSKSVLNMLASSHSDGRFGSIVGRYFQLKNIPTSNTNKRLSLIPIFKLLKSNNYIGITPDGPRGPKEKVSEGIIKIAKISKIPIIPIGFWSSKNFHLKSWDSFLITLPFSKCSFVWGDELKIPENLKDEEIINYQKILEVRINDCIEKAKKNTA